MLIKSNDVCLYLYCGCSSRYCPYDLQQRGQCQVQAEVQFSSHSWGWEVHQVQWDRGHPVLEVLVLLGHLSCLFFLFCPALPLQKLRITSIISGICNRLEAFSGMNILHSFLIDLMLRSFKCFEISLTEQTLDPATFSKVCVLTDGS